MGENVDFLPIASNLKFLQLRKRVAFRQYCESFITAMDIAITIMENGAPNLKKSANLYPPGFITNIFTGDESGDIKAG